MSVLLLCGMALLLGLRHGLDWDHIAAILDMVTSSPTSDGEEQFAPAHEHCHCKERSHRHEHPAVDVHEHEHEHEHVHLPATPAKSRLSRALSNLSLSLMYCAGHALVTLIMGSLALFFGTVVPKWLDEGMERFVGVTLLLLSVYLFYSLWMFLRQGQELRLKSRWMLVFTAIGNFSAWLKAKIHRHEFCKCEKQRNWDGKAAFSVGMIHAIGAETGTQVLLFASLAGVGNYYLGFTLLTAFTIGMVICNSLMAVAVAAGLDSHSKAFKPVMFIVGSTAAVFSLVVGIFFAFGMAESLPALF